MIAKNYLSGQELSVLNNLVSASFDLEELNAIEQCEMSCPHPDSKGNVRDHSPLEKPWPTRRVNLGSGKNGTNLM